MNKLLVIILLFLVQIAGCFAFADSTNVVKYKPLVWKKDSTIARPAELALNIKVPQALNIANTNRYKYTQFYLISQFPYPSHFDLPFQKVTERIFYHQKNNNRNNVFYLFLIGMFGVSLIINSNPGNVKSMFSSLLSNAKSGIYFKEKYQTFSFGTLVFNSIYFFTLACFIYYSLRYFKHTLYLFEYKIGLVEIIILVLIAYTTKYLFHKILSQVLVLQDYTNEYIFNTFLICKITGLVTMPLFFLMYFATPQVSEILYYLILFIFVISLVLRMFKGILSTLEIFSRSFFHFILYFCAVEILPLALIFKEVTKSYF